MVRAVLAGCERAITRAMSGPLIGSSRTAITSASVRHSGADGSSRAMPTLCYTPTRRGRVAVGHRPIGRASGTTGPPADGCIASRTSDAHTGGRDAMGSQRPHCEHGARQIARTPRTASIGRGRIQHEQRTACCRKPIANGCGRLPGSTSVADAELARFCGVPGRPALHRRGAVRVPASKCPRGGWDATSPWANVA